MTLPYDWKLTVAVVLSVLSLLLGVTALLIALYSEK